MGYRLATESIRRSRYKATSSMKDCPTTWRFVRTCPNQRLELQCVRCGNSFWPTACELAKGPPCGHCVGWWTFTVAEPVARTDN